MNRINHRGSVRRATVIAAGIAAVPLLAGCYNGFNAQTSSQPPSGDGLSTQVGDIQIRSAVWVRSLTDPANFTLSVALVNTGEVPDALTSVTTVPKAFTIGITDGNILMGRRSETKTGFNSDKYINAYGMIVPPSGYIETTFTFKRAGTVKGSVMAVPATGIYEGIEPNPAKLLGTPRPTASASASPSGSESPSASASASESVKPKASASAAQ